MTQPTKKVRQTTIEEYETPVSVENGAKSERVIEVLPVSTPEKVEIDEIDIEKELQIAVASGNLKLAKVILSELCETPVEMAITFLQKLPDGTQATITIERLADTMNQKSVFMVPCEVPIKLPNYTWYAQTADESDLYRRLVDEHGGGNYRFEIRYNKGFTGLSWKETLADSPDWIARHKTAESKDELEKLRAELEKITAEKQTAQSSDNSQMLQLQIELEKIKAENALAIAEMKHEAEIARIKAENQQTPIIESPLGLLQVATEKNNVELVKVAKSLLDNRSWVDFVLETLDNPTRMKTLTDAGIQIGSALLSVVLPGQVPPTQPPTTAIQKDTPKQSLLEQYQQRRRAVQQANISDYSEVKNNNELDGNK
jgi:hypothetical protein